MHKVTIPQRVIDRVILRCGKEHIFDDIEPSKTALVVVDMQNAFMLEGVAHAYVKTSQDIVPNINHLAAAVRRTGGLVVWIKTVWKEDQRIEWSVLDRMSLPQWTTKRVKALSRGSKGWELWEELDAQAEDLVVEKVRFSAFIQGSSNLHQVLQGHGVDTLLITGTVTNVCCESTARDAMMLNYKTIMVSDGNAAANDDEHNASLTSFYSIFGDVMSTDHVISCLDLNARAKKDLEGDSSAMVGHEE